MTQYNTYSRTTVALFLTKHLAVPFFRVRKRLREFYLEADAKSAARVVYNYYGGRERFPNISDEMMDAVDKADSAGFLMDDILEPKGWELLSFLMDARTGLGRFRDFRVSNYQLMMELIDCCRDMSIDDILRLPDVAERVELFFAQHELFLRIGCVYIL